MNSESFLKASATSALAISLLLPILQLDAVAKTILPPDRLRARRRLESLYHLKKSLSVSFEKNRKRVSEEHGDSYTPVYIQSRTEYITSEENIKGLVQDLLKKDEYPEILALEGDKEEEEQYIKATKEIYLYLFLKKEKRFVQVPLIPFATELAKKFEDIVTGTTLCFIADASGGLGPRMLNSIIASTDMGVVCIALIILLVSHPTVYIFKLNRFQNLMLELGYCVGACMDDRSSFHCQRTKNSPAGKTAKSFVFTL